MDTLRQRPSEFDSDKALIRIYHIRKDSFGSINRDTVDYKWVPVAQLDFDTQLDVKNERFYRYYLNPELEAQLESEYAINWIDYDWSFGDQTDLNEEFETVSKKLQELEKLRDRLFENVTS
jgi:hypothetical protein